MRWSNIFLIFRREVRDQIRDRRTLFMVFVLPILLYPILGMGMLKLASAFEQKPKSVVVMGAKYLPDDPRLLNALKQGFEPSLFDVPYEARLLNVIADPPDLSWEDSKIRNDRLRSRAVDVVMIVPPDIRAQIAKDRSAQIRFFYDAAIESSRTAARNVREVLSNWEDLIIKRRLKRDQKPESYVAPVEVDRVDVAPRGESSGTLWARLFPFLLVMMALTGAFYPAVDLCAGEKERGTMETLLISPASRAEIVCGKFLTVMLASMATALLNLASMGVTAAQVARGVGSMVPGGVSSAAEMQMTPPTLLSTVWMVLLLIPLSAFFSAISLALAVLARSMKEGQYYLTPLYMVSLPLIFASLVPGVELDLFTSMLPITGVSLLLRALMQAEFTQARRYMFPVLVPTIVYAWLALKWAVDLFRRESVLFREAERFELRVWLRHLIRDRQPIPGPGQALFCFSIMLASAWFLVWFMSSSLLGLVESQIVFILGPPVIMAILFTSSPRRTLRLRLPKWQHLLLAIGLALAVVPLTAELRRLVEALYPAPEAIKSYLGRMLGELEHNLWLGLCVVALVPAICEEVAFRGFILSGFQRDYSDRSAIIISSLLFGFLHVLLSLFQQLFNATILGLVLGLLAVRSRSLIPGIVFHFLNNGLALLLSRVLEGSVGRSLVPKLYRDPAQGLYHWYWIAVGTFATLLLLSFLWRLGKDEEAAAGDEATKPLVTTQGV